MGFKETGWQKYIVTRILFFKSDDLDHLCIA